MSQIFLIMWKEIRDNLRDKRSSYFAILYGALILPALTMVPLIIQANKHIKSFDAGTEFSFYEMEKAPNLVSYLTSRNLDAKPIGDDYEQQILDGDVDLVLTLDESYSESLQDGKPAKLFLHYRKERQDSEALYWHVRSELDNYARVIGSKRMTVRGFTPELLKPLDVIDRDLSEQSKTSSQLANIVTFLIFFSCSMGIFYLAADLTAGERERSSLEPLLSLPVSRNKIVLGKYLSVLVFCIGSMTLSLVCCALLSSFLPERFFEFADIPSVITWLKIFVSAGPACILISSFILAIATFAKSQKEAQTLIGLAMFVPLAPMLINLFMDVRETPILSAIPIQGNYLYTDRVMMDTSYSLLHVLPASLACIAAALAFLAVAFYLFRQDSILSS